MSVAITLHVLSVLIWVGGMFFAYMVLRPAAAALLEPPQRLPLWSQVFAGFFPWVWAAIALILASGLWIIFYIAEGFANVGTYVHLMFGLGLVMMALFMHVYFAPYKRLQRAVADKNWPEGAKQLNQIRRIVGINTLIGLVTVTIAIASGGRYL